MRGRQDHPASGQVSPHQPGKHLLAVRIERRGRLVEQPDRAWSGDQAGERKATALPGREVGGREVRKGLEPHRDEAGPVGTGASAR